MDQKKKMKSRDAARQRRGQQNDEFSELAASLPLPTKVAEKLDRLCVMRLSTSYIKNKHVLQQIKAPENDDHYNKCITDALGGFIFVLTEDGQCLYMSSNVTENLGLQQLDVTGNSIYKYIHPSDQEILAKQLGGQVPLEDMEIFDGMFCSDVSEFVKNPKQAVSAEFMDTPHRSFFLRMKSTLTSRGKSVNINASIYRTVQCSGTMQMYRTKLSVADSSLTRCMIGVGIPLTSQDEFGLVDRQTFTSKHSLDLAISSIDSGASNILGYKVDAMKGSSWYLFCHICDTQVLKTLHNSLLKIGQAVTGYYRVMSKTGGWLWIQTKANIVYVATTGQPQHISCVHHVVSGLEQEGQLLGTVQLEVPAAIIKKKRALEIIDEYKSPSLKSSKCIDIDADMFTNTMTIKSEPSLKSSPATTFIEDEDTDDGEYDDLPGLEFVDVADGFPEEALSSRSPFIPPPFHDAFIESTEDSSAVLDEIEMMNRAPYIPPPNIDKILSFEDLNLPEDLNEELGQTNIDLMSADLYDFNNARVPMYLLNKFVGGGKKGVLSETKKLLL